MRARLEGVRAMLSRGGIIQILKGADYPVLRFGEVLSSRIDPFVLVRAGGVRGGRSVFEIWLVAPALSAVVDPDADLQGQSEALYDLMRQHLAEVEVAPGPVYDPSGKSPHLTMVLTGAVSSRGLAA